MGYRIDYGGPIPQKKARTSTGFRVRSFVAGAFLAFCIMVRLLWPEGTQTLRSAFLPNDLTITEEAFSQLVTDLQQGVGFGDSVYVFCHRIISEVS